MTSKIAEALVKCGYASKQRSLVNGGVPEILVRETYWDKVLPFNDTLEGRRQADALEDWLYNKHRGMWDATFFARTDVIEKGDSQHQWRLDRIKWCFEQLEAS